MQVMVYEKGSEKLKIVVITEWSRDCGIVFNNFD